MRRSRPSPSSIVGFFTLLSVGAAACADREPLEPGVTVELRTVPLGATEAPVFVERVDAPERLETRLADVTVPEQDVRLKASGDLGGEEGDVVHLSVTRADGSAISAALEFECELDREGRTDKLEVFQVGDRLYQLSFFGRDLTCRTP